MKHQISFPAEGLLTSLALELFRVNILVILQTGLLGERLATLGPLAGERFLLGVNNQVSLEIPLTPEQLATVVTFEVSPDVLLAIVGGHVTLETSLGEELLAALSAQKLLLPTFMDDLIMLQQGLLSLETFPAAGCVTDEGEQIRVTNEVTFQIGFLVKHFVALGTRKVILGVFFQRIFVVEDPHVIPQVSFVGKIFLTNVTLQ